MTSIRRARGVSHPRTMTITPGVLFESIGQYSRFIKMMKLDAEQLSAGFGNGEFEICVNAHKLMTANQ